MQIYFVTQNHIIIIIATGTSIQYLKYFNKVMAGINFIILKINGIDVTDIPHEEAVQIFLKAPEPILVEVRRRLNDNQQQQRSIKKPSTPNSEIPERLKDQIGDDGVDSTMTIENNNSVKMGIDSLKPKREDTNSLESSSPVALARTTQQKLMSSSQNFSSGSLEDNIITDERTDHNAHADDSICSKCFVSTAVQTDMFTSEFIFNNSSIDDQTNEDNIFEECLAPEIDIEEITLRKSISNERLGLTVKYSSGNASGSDDTDTCTEVYISDIMPNSVAARDGRLRQGDQILQVNGRDVSNKEDTESLIAENKNAVTLLVSRCLYADDFNECGEYYEDEEQQITYENYSVEEQCLVDNRSIENVSQEHTTNTFTTKLFSSPRHISNVEKQPDELVSTLSATDPLHHANIKAHLESVNHEIAMLNTRVENMMLHKKTQNEYLISGNQNLNNVYRVPLDTIQSSAINESPTNRGNTVTQHDEKPLQQYSRNRIIDSDTEHIYETIPESSESEPFYCSPFESSDQNLVEKWLETQQDDVVQRYDRKKAQQTKSIKQNTVWQKTSTKSNSSGDDRENSSSAYNTGGSCNSNNQLTLELNSSDDPRDRDVMRSTLTLCPPQRSDIDVNEGCKQCQRQKKEKLSPKMSAPFAALQQSTSNYPQQNSVQRSRTNEQSIGGSNCSTLRGNEDGGKSAKALVSSTGQIPADTMYTNRANLQQTMLLQQKLFRQALLQQNQQVNAQIRTNFTAPNLSQYYFVSGQEVAAVSSKPSDNVAVKMEWKVKRRQDGTRYIVRRPTRNRILRDRAMKISEERNECTTEDDTISEIKTGRYWTKEERKKHIERARERRYRQQLIILNKNSNLSSPSFVPNTNSGGIGMVPSPSLTPATNRLTANIQQQQQQILQVTGKSPRQSSTRITPHPPDPGTMHKKILKKKTTSKDEPTEGGNKQIAGSGNSSNKMTGLLSVTTV